MYMGHSRRELILEADFEESQVVALMFFGLTCIKIVNFLYMFGKSDLLTLETIVYSWDIF